jgi:hypothetical protein
MLAPSKNRRFKPAFLEQQTNQAWGTNDESKAVRCESTALYRVCQARTTTSSSLNAYPPHKRIETGQTAVENCGNLVPARLCIGKLAMVGADRSISSAEFRLRPGGASNKARWGTDWPGTVELVDKRSLSGCDPASLTQMRLRLPAFIPQRLIVSGCWEREPAKVSRYASLCRKHFQERTADTADLSTTLLRSSGRDDKGEGGASGDGSCWTGPIFHRPCRNTFPRKDP